MRALVIDSARAINLDELSVDGGAEVVYARTPDDGLTRLKEGGWTKIFLDYDLGRDLTTGQTYEVWPCVEYIEENRNSFRDVQFFVKSSNQYGAAQVVAALQVAGLNVRSLT